MKSIIEKSDSEPKIIKHSRKKNNTPITIVIVFAIMIAFVFGITVTYFYYRNNPTVVTKNRTISENKVTEEAMEEAIDKIYNAVLCIEVLDDSGQTISTGTGFVYDAKGYVITNAHVVSTAKKVQGTLSNNKTVELEVLGTDSYTDLAVLKMDEKEVLQVASIGKSSNMKIGNTVFTVGSPMGSEYSGTVTKGILSGKDRLIETSNSSNSLYQTESFIVKVLQTDAAISPGNSGGPLVNLAGDVIGITSLKLVDSSVEGMGFAIPMDDAIKYIDILASGKSIERPIMGVQILDLTNKLLLQRYGINYDTNVKEGVILVKVNEDYPASSAGLKDLDIITKINGERINTTSKFKYELYKHSIGEEIEVTYIRDGKEKTTKVKLDKSK